MKTKVCILMLFALVFSLIFSFSSLGSGDYYIDDSGRYPHLDTELEGELAALYEKHSIHYVIYAYSYNRYTSYYKSDSEILSEFGLSTYSDVILLILEYHEIEGEWHCYLSTYGRGTDVISDGEVDYLMADGGIMDYALTQNMGEGLRRYLSFIDTASRGNGIPIVERIHIPILLGLLGALIGFLCVFISYKRKVRSDCYPLKEFTNMDLTHSDDRFTGSHVTRRHAPRSSGSSGGRSGGGGRRGGR